MNIFRSQCTTKIREGDAVSENPGFLFRQIDKKGTIVNGKGPLLYSHSFPLQKILMVVAWFVSHSCTAHIIRPLVNVQT